jgi:hypothetical protein
MAGEVEADGETQIVKGLKRLAEEMVEGEEEAYKSN